ncbi:glutathione S-transferase [Neisseriaceae bacterium JH1-16]|nr:glutathione S-transferase [Neisseriaceae bacterium JH1-16]
MITVHHLNNSRSQRVLWLLEELELPYQIQRYERDPATMLAPAALRKVHPLGKSPVIQDGDLILAESGAIIDYLIERYGQGRLAPARDTPDGLRYNYWLHYAEGSLMPLLVMRLVFDRLSHPPVPWLLRPLASVLANGVKRSYLNPQIRQHLDYLEGEIGEQGWFVGDNFSAADIQLSFPLEAANARSGLEHHPKLAAFLEQIHARPAYLRAVEQGGPYELLH